MKKIPIGLSDFSRIIEENDYYYVDKSLLIKDIVEDGSNVILLPRPRRFGKTLNMTMLKYFFEKTDKDKSGLFSELNIYKYKDIMKKCGKYPMIYLTFKDEKHVDFENYKKSMASLMAEEYRRHSYLVKSNILDDYDKKEYENIMSGNADIGEVEKSLKKLSYFLYKFYGERVIILIDEYDTPIQSGYINNYYDEIINFMRNFLSGGLKDNEYLEKSVLTGILRVAKESIFSGLNNLSVCTILNSEYSEYFGFTEEETENILKYYEVDYDLADIKKWYNGYTFGDKIIYNPWSILNYTKRWKEGFQPYWTNTSSNDLVKRLITKGGEELKTELEDLIKGRAIEKQINENIVMGEIENSTENVWSFLLLSGYLKIVNKRIFDKRLYCSLMIPNYEVEYVYEEIILGWFKNSISTDKFNRMLKALTTGDIKTFGKIFKEYVLNSVSYFDIGGGESEKVYHAFVLGMLVALSNEYEVRSNRESGYGRYDVMLIPKDKSKYGIVIEFKKLDEDDESSLEDTIKVALKQIEEKKYSTELISREITNIIELAIAFNGKEVMIRQS